MRFDYYQPLLGAPPELRAFWPCCPDAAQLINTHVQIRSWNKHALSRARYNDMRLVTRSKPHKRVQYCPACGTPVSFHNIDESRAPFSRERIVVPESGNGNGHG